MNRNRTFLRTAVLKNDQCGMAETIISRAAEASSGRIEDLDMAGALSLR